MFHQLKRLLSPSLKALGDCRSLSSSRRAYATENSAFVSIRAWQPVAQSCTSTGEVCFTTSGAQRLLQSSVSNAAPELQHVRALRTTASVREEMQSTSTAGPASPASTATPSSSPSAAGPAASHLPAPTGLAAVPPIAKVLGFAGAIPFLALSPPIAQALPMLPAELVGNAALLQIGYGATIASFLGGIHWAMAMAEYGGRGLSAAVQAERYLWSVTPCLMAWPAVMLQPGPGSLIVGTTLGVVYAVDRHFAAKGLLPAWYMTLRLPLTLAAVIGMGCTLVASLMYGDRPRPRQPSA